MNLKSLRRNTHAAGFIPEIDGLRFFAIMTVVAFHLNTAYSRQTGVGDAWIDVLGGLSHPTQPAWWMARLDLGVKVFFAISGMVLALPFFNAWMKNRPMPETAGYFYRRLTRLEPPFVLSLTGFFIVHTCLLKADADHLYPHFLSGLFYAHLPVYGELNPINPVTWSLETEAQFYIIVPLLFWALFKLPRNAMRILVLVSLFLFSIWFRRYSNAHGWTRINLSVFSFLSNFLVGIAFAWAFLRNRDYFTRRSWHWDAAGLLAIFCLFYFYKPQVRWSNNLMFNAGLLLLLWSVFKGSMLNRFFTWTPVYIIGGMCYSIYLLHYAFLFLFARFTGGISTGHGYAADLCIQMLLGIPAVLVVSAIFFVAIEKPCMDRDWPVKLQAYLRKRLKLARN